MSRAKGVSPEKYKEQRRQFREANREKLRAIAREDYRRNRSRKIAQACAYQRRRRYGITDEEYARMVTACGGRCAVCRERPVGRFAALCVDHDHKTGAVRGMLCHGCNTALGMLKEDPLRIRALAAYAEQFDWLKT